VNWNGGHMLPACLAALDRQTVRDFQVWVVDNASSDGSRELLARDFPTVRVFVNRDNRGFAGGNNTALREVTTPFAVLLNNDATPDADWLERLLAPFALDPKLAAVTSKVVFAPRYVPLQLETTPFVPGGADPRELGLRIQRIEVDGEDVTERVLWERLAYGPEGQGAGRYRWTRPTGELLVPVTSEGCHEVAIRWLAEQDKDVTLSWLGGSAEQRVTEQVGQALTTVPAGVPTVDVINNAGSVVLTAGYGADRGYQEVDRGQYDTAEDVFALCGCAVALRTDAGAAVGWFDEAFFLYYEDTDLSWRLRAAGWRLSYEPTAKVRHIHAASSVEWSPRFVFHTDRNRLLMLTKNATAGRATREVLRYPLTTVSMAFRLLRQGVKTRRRPAIRPTLLRLKVLGSYLRLLPAMLGARRRLKRSATVSRGDLEAWLINRG
jgi:GT2 family glycosyltransferase